MNLVGLTGGIATGKTTASDFINRLGIPVIDADIINKKLLSPGEIGYQQLLKTFPNIPLTLNLELDKRYIRDLIFKNINNKKLIENILHPLIKNQIKQDIATFKKQKIFPYCIISVPLLIESNFQDIVKDIWVTNCPKEIQIKRLMKRDAIQYEDAELILSHQLTAQKRNAYATEIIDTLDLNKMKQQLEKLHQQQLLLNSK